MSQPGKFKAQAFVPGKKSALANFDPACNDGLDKDLTARATDENIAAIETCAIGCMPNAGNRACSYCKGWTPPAKTG